MSDAARLTVDQEKIKKIAQAGVPLSITTYTLPREMEAYMNEILAVFLKEIDQDFLTDSLEYCLGEMTTNAKKANTKRVYFQELGLDITSEEDYFTGMKTFKTDTLENINHYLQLQHKAGLYIKVILQARNQKIKMEVRNNSKLTVFEYKRIHDKLTRAHEYDSMQDAAAQILDNSEGAGLGLILMILLLKKVGLAEEDYQVFVENDDTVVRVILPANPETKRSFDLISSELVNLINELPQFPENIMTINKLISDPDAKLSDIAMHISNDVALTADLLKLVNSAAFGLSSRCQSIPDAVKLVGLRGIRNLLFSLGSMKVLGERTDEQKNLWKHSFKVAFYSYNLARNFCSAEKGVVGDAYVCGLLHDMGKIIFTTAHPDVINSIKSICQQKNISPKLIEKVMSGTNHETLGALIAKKWNFPDSIVNSIQYHHAPEAAPADHKRLVNLIALANLVAHYEEGDIEYYQIDNTLLDSFGIKSEETLQKITEKIKTAFNMEQERQGR